MAILLKDMSRRVKLTDCCRRPAITGLAVPGMPIGAPGMTVEGYAPEPFDVIAFDQAGNTEVYASYQP